MQWALRDGRIVLTHDLDIGAILAATQAIGPSVVQVRTQDIRPKSLAPRLIPWLRQYTAEL
jgi:predicted nuclease of predicted toxin-antitoxin system